MAAQTKMFDFEPSVDVVDNGDGVKGPSLMRNTDLASASRNTGYGVLYRVQRLIGIGRASLVRGFAILLVLVLQGCDTGTAPEDAAVDLPRFQVDGRDFRPWVEFLDPEQVSPGFNLVLFERRVPTIVDLAGRTVHSWPAVRAIGRARLNTNGDLLVIGADDSVSEYSWQGEKTFTFRLAAEGDIPHHDVRYLDNGNILVLAQTAREHSDYLLEIDRQGEIVWEWRAADALEPWIAEDAQEKREATHINSIQEVPENQWFAEGDERFRPGNILISARNLNRLFVVERPSGQVVWNYRGQLDYQHEAIMIPNGRVGQGLITVFNNRKHRPSFARMSQIIAIDPRSNRVVWAFEDRAFFSSVGGSQQPLPNGNVLVTSTQGGRAFEITVDGEIVWQWIPNVLPMRLVRYSKGHCPQLARADDSNLPVVSAPGWRDFHDLELHLFDLPEEWVRKTIQGEKIDVLRNKNACRALWLPPNPEIMLNYGLDEARLDKRMFKTRFIATVRPLPVGISNKLIDESLGPDSDSRWRKNLVSLDAPAFSWVELCVSVESSGSRHEDWAVKVGLWQNIQVFTDAYRVRQALPPQDEQEMEILEKQLKAIGYMQ